MQRYIDYNEMIDWLVSEIKDCDGWVNDAVNCNSFGEAMEYQQLQNGLKEVVAKISDKYAPDWAKIYVEG